MKGNSVPHKYLFVDKKYIIEIEMSEGLEFCLYFKIWMGKDIIWKLWNKSYVIAFMK